jgi:hypothetical protein
MSENKVLGSFESNAIMKEGVQGWFPVVYERWSGESHPSAEYVGETPFEHQEDAIEQAEQAASQLAEQRQQIINDELSKMRGWLDLSHEERVKRAKATFPAGSPFGN